MENLYDPLPIELDLKSDAYYGLPSPSGGCRLSTESFSSVASTSFSPLTSTSHGHHVNRFDLIDSTYSGHHVSPKYPFTPTSSVLSGTGSSYSAGSSPVFGPSTPTGSSSGQPHYGSDHLCNAMEGMGYAHSMILHSHSPPSHRSQPATSSFVVSPERHYCSSPLSMVHSSDGHYDMHAPSPSTSGMGSAGNLTPVTLSYNAHDGSLIMLEPKVDPLSKTDPLDLEPLKLEPLKLEPYSPGGPSSGMIFSTFTSSSSSGIDSPCTSLVQSNGHQIQNSTGNYNVRISAVQRTSAALHMAQQQQHPQKVSSSGASGSIHTQSPRFSIEINRILQPDPNDEERKEQERQLCRHGSFSSNTISQVNRESSGNKLDQHRRLPKQCKDGDNYGCQSQVQISSRNRTQQAHGDDDGLEEYYTKIGERYWCTWKDGVPCNRLFKRIEHMKRHIKTTHLNLSEFKCDFCKHHANRLDNLRQHLKLHTRLPKPGTSASHRGVTYVPEAVERYEEILRKTKRRQSRDHGRRSSAYRRNSNAAAPAVKRPVGRPRKNMDDASRPAFAYHR